MCGKAPISSSLAAVPVGGADGPNRQGIGSAETLAGIARRRALAPEIVGGPPTAELRALFRGRNLPRPSRHGTFNPTALQALGPTALQDDDRHRGLVPRALDCDSGVDWAMADSVVTSVDEKAVFDADTMPHDHTT